MNLTYYPGNSHFTLIGAPNKLEYLLKTIHRLSQQPNLRFAERLVLREFVESYPKKLKEIIEGE